MREIVAELRDRRPDRGGGRARPRLRRRRAASLAFENTNAVARYAAQQTIVFGEDIDPDAAIARSTRSPSTRCARSPPASPTSWRSPASGPHTVEELETA